MKTVYLSVRLQDVGAHYVLHLSAKVKIKCRFSMPGKFGHGLHASRDQGVN